MKKAYLSAAALAAVLALQGSPVRAQTNEINIGISIVTTGPSAALGIPEIWRFDGETFKILVLANNGKYKERTRSLAFPTLPMDGFVRFVKRLDSVDEVSLIEEFTDWLRSDVVGKKPSGERKNGRR